MTGEPFPSLSINYWGALKAFFKLAINKDDIGQAVNLVTALNGSSAVPAARDFTASEYGQKILSDADYLAPLYDQDYLLNLPQGSLGRVYAESLIAEGLNPAAIDDTSSDVDSEFAQFKESHPAYFAYGTMLNQVHDLYHTLTGYDRDLIGEAALLKFTSRSMGGRGSNVLAELVALRVRTARPSWPMRKIMSHAKEMADQSSGMVVTDIIPLLPLQLWEARAACHIRPDPLYAAISKEEMAEVMLSEAVVA